MADEAEVRAVDEERACVAFATMLNCVDADAFVPLLAPHAVWESQQVLTPIVGKANVAAHLAGKMKALLAARPGNAVCADLGRCGSQRGNSVQCWSAHDGCPCVVVSQGADFGARRASAVVLFEVDGGLVARVDLCTVVPPPSSAERLSVFPGLKRSCWPGDRVAASEHAAPLPPTASLQLADILPRENVLLNVAARDADELHLVVARVLAKREPVEWFHVYDALAVRHRIHATGFKGGLALPHQPVPGVRGVVACLARTREPIDFGALDGPSRLFFAIVAPGEGQLLKAVMFAARALASQSDREEILKARTDDEMYDRLRSLTLGAAN
jgi:PTS system nitrogen regulatory IIA component